MKAEALNINIQGTPEIIAQRNEQLKQDLATYATRPFLNRQERCDMQDYYSRWSINHIIGILNFDNEGNYLPNVYHAPREILDMLYPLEDLIEFERQGTLIIDREQYSPELRNLSFFIYMVDADLYEEYKSKQHFLGTTPTFMFDRNNPNGVRVFKDYYALVRHLRSQRLVSFCLGPRTMFYLRYYLHQIHVHTTNKEYSYGIKEDGTLALQVLESIKRHLAFRKCEELTYEKTVTVDQAALFRKLATVFNVKLPDIERHYNKTTIKRYSKQSIRSMQVFRLKNNKVKKADELYGLKPWHHLVQFEDKVLAYVWDTREIQMILSTDDFDINEFGTAAVDNGTDLVVKWNTPEGIREFAEQNASKLAVQFRDGQTTLTNVGTIYA